MWARIALYHSIAYDTNILFTFHQTDASNKKRLQTLPKYDPKLKLLESVLRKPPDGFRNQNDICNHIKKWLAKMCLWFVNANERKAAVEFMKYNNAYVWSPVMNRAIKTRPAWFVLRFAAVIYRAVNSRTAIKIIGGQIATHGVLMRLKT